MSESRTLYEYDLLPLCERIHGACTGSGDGIPDEEAERISEWLTWRLSDGWQTHDFPWRGDRYDAAVRELCRAALDELSAYLSTPEPEPPRSSADDIAILRAEAKQLSERLAQINRELAALGVHDG